MAGRSSLLMLLKRRRPPSALGRAETSIPPYYKLMLDRFSVRPSLQPLLSPTHPARRLPNVAPQYSNQSRLSLCRDVQVQDICNSALSRNTAALRAGTIRPGSRTSVKPEYSVCSKCKWGQLLEVAPLQSHRKKPYWAASTTTSQRD